MYNMKNMTLGDLMKKKILVYGLGISNRAVCKALKDKDIGFQAFDDSEEVRDSLRSEIPEIVEKIGEYDILFVAPGIPPNNDIVAKSNNIATDIDLFFILKPEAKAIGVTGTNGKSTLTKFITHALLIEGQDAVSVGNIGSSALSEEKDHQWYVFELSSFQLHYSSLIKLKIGVIINIAPDHIDWHGSFEEYKKAKLNIVSFSDTNFIPSNLHSSIINNSVIDLESEDPIRITEQIFSHLSIPFSDKTFESFEALPHRDQLLKTKNGVSFYNDSKATNPHATAYALKNHEQVSLIAGGLEKGDYTVILPFKEKIAKVYLTGEPVKLLPFLKKNKIPFEECKTIENALNLSIKEHLSDTILLSPMGASFDQFKSFEERGNHFIELVKKI